MCWNNPKSFSRKRPKHGHLFYTGYTNNILRRLKEHRNGHSYGKRPSFTSHFHGRIELGFVEVYTKEEEAMKREIQIKPFSRDKKIKLIQDCTPQIQELVSWTNKKAN